MRAMLTAIACAAVLGVGVASAQDRPEQSVQIREMKIYACPKHPEIQGTWSARCPTCGERLREKGRMMRPGEEPRDREEMRGPTVVRGAEPGLYGPETLLRVRRVLNLSDRQVRQLREIALAAHSKAMSVLTDAQRARLRSYARAVRIRRERDAWRDRFRDQYRDRYRDQTRDWDRDRWRDGQRWYGRSDPSGDPAARAYSNLFDYAPLAYGFGYAPGLRELLTGEGDEEEGLGDEEGFGDEGFGDEGFGPGFGEGFGDEGFGEGFGDEGFGEGFGDEGFEPGFGEEFGREGEEFGREGFGREGEESGREGFGGERFGGGPAGGESRAGGEARGR